MTWPLTFSSPPSVEFHLRGTALGTLKAGARAKEVARGSYNRRLVSFYSPWRISGVRKTYRAAETGRKHCD